MSQNNSQLDKYIAAVGIILAAIGLLQVPEIRCLLRLPQDNCALSDAGIISLFIKVFLFLFIFFIVFFSNYIVVNIFLYKLKNIRSNSNAINFFQPLANYVDNNKKFFVYGILICFACLFINSIFLTLHKNPHNEIVTRVIQIINRVIDFIFIVSSVHSIFYFLVYNRSSLQTMIKQYLGLFNYLFSFLFSACISTSITTYLTPGFDWISKLIVSIIK